jgi:hypothetical protein
MALPSSQLHIRTSKPLINGWRKTELKQEGKLNAGETIFLGAKGSLLERFMDGFSEMVQITLSSEGCLYG